MPEDQNPDVSETTPNIQPESSHTSKPKKILLLGSSFLVLLILGISVALLFLTQQQNQTAGPTPTRPTEPTPAVEPTPDISPNVTYIAYIQGNNLLLVDNRGSRHHQLTDNLDQSVRYNQLRWLDSDTLSYVKCVETCGVYTLSATTKQESTIVPETLGYTAIYGYDITNGGAQTAYTYLSPDRNRLFIMLLEEGTPIPIKEIPFRASTPTALIDLNQQAIVRFSPDGTHLMVINTDTQPNTQQMPHTLWVFAVETNSELFAIGRQNTLVTFGTWIDNQTLLFKYGTDIIRKSILHQGEQLVGSMPEAYDVTLSTDSKTIAYWTYAQETKSTILGTFMLETKTNQARTAHFYKPQWMDASKIVALQTKQVAQEQPALFETNGRLMMVDISTNATFELVSDGVTSFSIRPTQ